MLITPDFDNSEFDVNEAVPMQFIGNRNAVATVLQNFRDFTQTPAGENSRIEITSCYRDPARNATVPNAVSDSQHLTASAADVEFLDMGQQQVAAQLLEIESTGQGPDYSQCIFYIGDPHVHIGIPFTNGTANYQKLVHFLDGHYETLDASVDIAGNYTGNMALLAIDPPNPSRARTTPAKACLH